ncbi:hypothetical protein JXB01_01500 [Candidatus Micrarchaeota archaeon]|nr:hypothetical protein [Candidatus Micrarchaeota archaeon]
MSGKMLRKKTAVSREMRTLKGRYLEFENMYIGFRRKMSKIHHDKRERLITAVDTMRYSKPGFNGVNFLGMKNASDSLDVEKPYSVENFRLLNLKIFTIDRTKEKTKKIISEKGISISDRIMEIEDILEDFEKSGFSLFVNSLKNSILFGSIGFIFGFLNEGSRFVSGLIGAGVFIVLNAVRETYLYFKTKQLLKKASELMKKLEKEADEIEEDIKLFEYNFKNKLNAIEQINEGVEVFLECLRKKAE